MMDDDPDPFTSGVVDLLAAGNIVFMQSDFVMGATDREGSVFGMEDPPPGTEIDIYISFSRVDAFTEFDGKFELATIPADLAG